MHMLLGLFMGWVCFVQLGTITGVGIIHAQLYGKAEVDVSSNTHFTLIQAKYTGMYTCLVLFLPLNYTRMLAHSEIDSTHREYSVKYSIWQSLTEPPDLNLPILFCTCDFGA